MDFLNPLGQPISAFVGELSRLRSPRTAGIISLVVEKVLLNDRYTLEKQLGSGGMAVVYRAHDQMLERTVAIKLLREDYSSIPEFRQRFHQEAKAAANLVHPNIVTVHDFGMDSGRLYIVMEYVPGTNLNDLLQKQGRFSVDESIRLIRQACAGIGYAHRAGLVHCDVKPHNLLITPDNRLKVTDFGIARALVSIQTDEHNEMVWGSPQYYAPEQASGKPPSTASDVYSLGVVLFLMLTGRLPFISANAAEMARLHRLVPPPSARQFNPSIPSALDEIILKVLAKEPSQRYRTADQLGRILIALDESRSLARQAAMGAALDAPGNGPEPDSNQTTQVPAQPATQISASEHETMGRRLAPTQPPVPTYHQLKPDVVVSRPVSAPSSTAPDDQAASALDREQAGPNPLDIDWISLGLGLLALIAVGGLVPLWVWVFISYTQPIP